MRLVVMVCALLGWLTGCGEPVPAIPDATAGDWRCPATWVRHARGGCGPAVLLCVADGGAAVGACEGADLSRPPVVDDGDGGTATGFWRAPDGAIRGAWKEPGEPGGPPARDWHPPALDGLEERVPAADWAPDAGIPSCPEGWARTSDGVCDPRLPTDCPEGSGPLPGGQCTRTALRDCPAGAWADPGAEAVGAQVLRVREGEDDARADGSAARPYGTIGAALAAAREGAWVLVAAGTYRERVRFARSAHVRGVCAARVTIEEPTPIDPARALVASAPEARTRFSLHGASLRGGAAGVVAGAGSRADVRRLVVDRAAVGVLASGTEAEVVVEDFFYDGSSAAASATAVSAELGARASVTRTYVFRAAGYGARCLSGNGSLSITDSLVRGGRALMAGGAAQGAGVASVQTCDAHAQRVVVERTAGRAFAAVGGGASLVVEDSVARDTRPADSFNIGVGLSARQLGHLTARRVLVTQTQGWGAAAFLSAFLHLDTSVVRETRQVFGDGGGGVIAAYGGQLDVARTVVHHSQGTGIGAYVSGAEASIAGSVVRDTLVDANGEGGNGVIAQLGASVLVRGSAILRSASAAVIAQERGLAHVRDVRVSGSTGRDGTFVGFGLYSRAGIVDAMRVRVSEIRGIGAVAIDGATLLLQDVLIDQPDAERRKATGVAATEQGRLTARRVRIGNGHTVGVACGNRGQVTLLEVQVDAVAPFGGEGAGILAESGLVDAHGLRLNGGVGVGVRASNAGTHVHLQDAVIQHHRARTDGLDGHAVVANDGASVELSSVLVGDAQRVAVVGTRGVLDLEDVVVEETRPRADGTGSAGISFQGGTAHLRRVVLNANLGFGLLLSERASLDASDLAIYDTAAVFDGTDSAAIGLTTGARAVVVRALLARNAHSALIVRGVGAALRADDLLVLDTRPTRLGFGVGVGTAEGATARLVRTSVVGAGGFALGAVRQRVEGASIDARDVYVATVHDRSVRNAFPQGPPVAYGFAVGTGCRADVARAVVVDAGWGFFQTAGVLRWQEGVVLAPREGPGAVSGAGIRASSTLLSVRFIDSPSAEVARDVALPEVLLPPPPAACALPPCAAR